MFLKKFKIVNFRAIEELEFDFDKGLNIIIGENNSGKTAIIDALRLSLGNFYSKSKDIYCLDSDFRIDEEVIKNRKTEKSGLETEYKPIEFTLIFDANEEEMGWFSELASIDEKGNYFLKLNIRHELINYIRGTKINRRIKTTMWGGEFEGERIPSEILHALKNIYLNPLRDVEKSINSRRNNILNNLYSNIIIDKNIEKDQEVKKEILEEINKNLNEIEKLKTFVSIGEGYIKDHLENLTFSEWKKQDIIVDLSSIDFEDIIQQLNIKILLPYMDKEYLTLFQNGLGLNNLIYTSIVLGNLIQIKEIFKEEYNLLLIEEPEAHLHPQLQNKFFNYLNDLNKEKNIQIIATSHSPTITAKTELNSLIILQNMKNKIYSSSIKHMGLTKNTLNFLQKFLDVTNSQLFFANGIILVEGISEAILLPIFSKIIDNGEYDIESAGIEVVNVQGLSFKHFVSLFSEDEEKNTKYYHSNENKLKNKCVIITDEDTDKKNQNERVNSIKKYEDNKKIKVETCKETFEKEIIELNFENEIFLKAYEKTHNNKYNQFKKDNFKKEDFLEYVNKMNKSEFALNLSILLEESFHENHNFKVPKYIENAIKFFFEK